MRNAYIVNTYEMDFDGYEIYSLGKLLSIIVTEYSMIRLDLINVDGLKNIHV